MQPILNVKTKFKLEAFLTYYKAAIKKELIRKRNLDMMGIDEDLLAEYFRLEEKRTLGHVLSVSRNVDSVYYPVFLRGEIPPGVRDIIQL